MHKETLVIIGASGQGKVAADIAKLIGRYHNILFLDDASTEVCMGIPVLGKSDMADDFLEEADFFVAIGNPVIRRKFLEELEAKGANIVSLIHPHAIIGTNVQIGLGTAIMAGAVLNPECRIGKGCIINTCASVDHDCVLGDYVHVSVGAHLAGMVVVGQETWIGAGATVSNNITIYEGCIIGAGAVVIKDLSANCTAVGVPAKPIKFRE